MVEKEKEREREQAKRGKERKGSRESPVGRER